MAFTVTTTTLGGVAARLITGSGNLDDLATALASHGVTKNKRTLTFSGTGANTYYAMDGTLTEQRSGVWTIHVATQSFLCLARASGSVCTLGKIETTGAISSTVNVQYTPDHFPQGADPWTSAEYKCFAGIGTLNFHAGSLSWETPYISGVETRSDMDIWSATAGVNLDAVQVAFQKSTTQYVHIYTSLNVTTTQKTSFLYYSGSYQEVLVWGYHPTATWNVAVGSFYVTTGLRLVYPGANTFVTVQKPQYTQLESYSGVVGGTCKVYDPSVDYHTGAADNMLFTIYRTVKTTFKDTLAVSVGSPAPNLVVLNPDASTDTVAYASGYVEFAAKQSVTSAGVAYNTSGTGWTDYGTYSFYAVGFGYAAAQTGINVKTAHSGNAGITMNFVSAKSPLVTTAYGSVVTSGFALTTGTDTLSITTSRTTDQSAEYLFKHAYDNPATTYWFGKLHTPAVQNAAGYIDFGATNITVTGVTLSGSAFSTTGTVTLASGAICSANVVKSSGVFSAGDLDNVTGSVTLTGSARWDITSGGVAPAGSAAAGNTIRVTSASSGADFDFQAFTFNVSTTFENTSGQPITLTLAGGQTAPTKLETSGTITIVAPVITQGLAFTGLVAGSQVKVFNTGTTTELFSDSSSATSETWSQTWAADVTVDYTVMKAGYLPIRVVGVVAGQAVASVPITQTGDRAYAASSGLTYGTTATVDTGTSHFTVTTATTVQNWYSFMIESWIAQSALKNTAFPISTNGPNSFTLEGWEFSSGLSLLYRDGLRYTAAGVATATYAALYSVDTASGLQIKYQQTDGGTTTSASNTGKIDQLVQVYGDASHGNFDKRSFLVLKVQKDGYDHAETDVVGTYGSLEDQLYVVGLNPLSNGLTTGAPTVNGSPTITDHGASPVTWHGKAFSITITDSATGNDGETLMRWIRYNLGAGGTFQGKDGFCWHDLVQVNGDGFKTVRGNVYGDTGATLKGVRVITNAGADHPDFNLHTADDGTTYVPVFPAAAAATVLANTRVQLYNVTTDAEVDSQFVTGTAYSYTVTAGVSPGDTLRLRACKKGYEAAEATALWVAGGVTFLLSQNADAVYSSWGIDGATVTEYALDGTNIQIDANDVDGATEKTRLGAFYSYALTTEAGIRTFYGAMTFLSSAAIRINVGVVNLKIDNINATTALYFTDLSVRLYRSDGSSIIAPSSYSIHNDYSGVPDVVETGVSGLTGAESSQLLGLPSAAATASAVLAAASTTPIAADIKKVNAQTISGAGVEADPWGP